MLASQAGPILTFAFSTGDCQKFVLLPILLSEKEIYLKIKFIDKQIWLQERVQSFLKITASFIIYEMICEQLKRM